MPALSAQDAAHLLRRSGFGGGGALEAADRAAITGMDRATAVDLILSPSNVSGGRPPLVYNGGISDTDKLADATLWWFDRMATARVTGRTAGSPAPSPLQEKLSLFWHSHFATSNQKVGSSQAM